MIKVKKLLAAFMSAAMLLATLPQAMAAETADYLYKTAQEADKKTGYGDYSAYMAIIADSSKLPTLEFDFNLKSDGLYDIWLDSSSGWWKTYTGYKMNDDTDIKANSGTQVGDATSDGLYGVGTAWHRVDTRALSAGENTLTVAPSQKDADNNRYVSVVKRVAVVPRSYYWDPTKSETPTECEAPAASEYGFTYATDYAAKSGGWVQSSVRKTTMAVVSSNEAEHTLTYEFNLANDGSYDLWLENVNNDWASYLKYSIDGGEYLTATGIAVGNATESYDFGISTQWQKINVRNLSKGYHTIALKAEKYIDGRYLGAVNAIALSPTEWGWSPADSAQPGAKQYDYYYKTAQEASKIVGYKDYSAYMEILADSAELPELEFKFNLKTGGLYDIWLDTTSGWWKNYTGYKMNNDTAVKGNEGVQFGDATAADSVGLTTAWHKADTRALPAGENTLTVSPSQKDAANNRYVSMVKRIAVVPRSYYWDPTKSVTPTECEAPAAGEYGFTYATDCAAKTGDWVQSSVRKTTMAIVSSNEAEHTLTYEFNLANDGSYDLWIENVNNDWSTHLKYSIDGGEYLSATGTYVGDSTPSYDFEISTQWQKISVEKLSAGTHTVTLKMEKYTDGRYLGAVNAIALSPTEWKWSPVKSEKPEKPIPQNYAWIEAEDFEVPEGGKFVGEANSKASGGAILKLDTTDTSGTQYTASYSFEVTEDAEFDIDILSDSPHMDYMSNAKYKIDDNEYKYMKDNIVTLSDSLYSVTGTAVAGTYQGMKWFRIGREDLSSGTHTITIMVDEPRPDYPETGSVFFAFDAVAVVPRIWNYTPKITYTKPAISDYVYINANNGYYSCDGYTEANNVLQVIADSAAEQPSLMYLFQIKDTDTYDIWIDSATKANYDTLFEYSIDDADYVRSTADKYGKYTKSNIGMGALSTAWHKVTTAELAGGEVHTLNLRAFIDPETNRYISAFNRIVVVPSSWNWYPQSDGEPYNTENLDLTITESRESIELERDTEASVSFKSTLNKKSDADILFEIRLAWNGDPVTTKLQRPSKLLSKRTAGMAYTDNVSIKVPFTAPDGDYEIQVRTGGHDEWTTIAAGTLGDASEQVKKTAAVSSLSISGNVATAAIAANGAESTKARLEFYKDNLLWAVADLGSADVNEETAEYSFGFGIPKLPSGEYTVKLGIEGFETTSVSAAYTSDANADIKPLSNGSYYSKKTGSTHFWYVNQEGAMVWDGEPFVPMGGMFCSRFITSYNPDDPDANMSLFTQDLEVLNHLDENGIKDLYINAAATDDNAAAWQFLTDYLDAQGFRYGIQPAMYGGKQSGYFAAANVNAIKAAIKNGTASATAKLEQLNYPDSVSAKYYVISDGKITETGNASYTESGRFFTLTATGLKSASGTVYFLPYASGSSIGAPNVTNKAANMAGLKKFFASLRPGDGVRLVIDPTYNETAYANQAESFIPYSEAYAADFAAWLEKKYSSISELNNAWGVSPTVSSFDEAATLMPVSTTDGVTALTNVNTDAAYFYNSRSGCMWDDCVLFRDANLAEYNMDAADVVKSEFNVPVVYKNVGYFNPFFVNTRTSGGHDGVGAEAYGSFSDAAVQSAIAKSICAESQKTMWNIVTETNTEQDMNKKLESGIISYGDKTTMYQHFNTLYAAGAKGIFDFVFNNDNELVKPYAYESMPEMYGWLGEYANSLNPTQIAKDSANEQVFAIFPAKTAYWNWNGTGVAHNKRSAVIEERDTDLFGEKFLSNGSFVISTNSLDTSANTIIINIKDAPLSKIYGKHIDEKFDSIVSKKNVIVAGLRNDVGQIPSIDKYYTAETITNAAGETVQVLNPPAGAITLAETDGKVWAFKYGNLYVLANDNWTKHSEYLTGNSLASSAAGLNRAYYTQNGTVYAMPKTGANKVTFKFNNYLTDTISGTVIISINGGEELIEIPVSVAGGAANAEISENINVISENITSVNYYFWDSLNGMTPIVPKQ